MRWEYAMVWFETHNRNFTAAKVIYLTPQGPQSVDVEGSKGSVLLGKDSKKIADNAFREIARLGYEGWELVSVVTEGDHATYAFKRPLQVR